MECAVTLTLFVGLPLKSVTAFPFYLVGLPPRALYTFVGLPLTTLVAGDPARATCASSGDAGCERPDRPEACEY